MRRPAASAFASLLAVSVLVAAAAPAEAACPLAFNPPMVAFNGAGRAVVTITNNAAMPVTIAGFATNGANAGDFTVDPGILQPPFAIAAGAAVTVAISFLPRGPGVRGATLDVSVGGGLGPCALPLSGRPAMPVIDAVPPRVDFGNLGVLAKAVKQVVLVNKGGAALSLTDFRFIDPRQSASFLINNAPVPDMNGQWPRLKPGEQLSFSVLCSPQSAARFEAQIEVSSDDPILPKLVIPLTCSGAEPELKVEPAMVDFGGVPVGSQSAPTPVAIRNTGAAPLSISSVTLGGTNANQFHYEDPGRFELPAGSSKIVPVSCAPAARGVYSGSLVVTAAGFPPATATLHCVGAKRQLLLDSGLAKGDRVDFDELWTSIVGQTPITLVITATVAADSSPITIREVRSDKSVFVVSTEETTRTPLAPGATTEFRLSFVPDDGGSFDGTVSVLAEGEAQPVATLPVHGSATTVATVQPVGCSVTARRGGEQSILLLLTGVAVMASRRRRW